MRRRASSGLAENDVHSQRSSRKQAAALAVVLAVLAVSAAACAGPKAASGPDEERRAEALRACEGIAPQDAASSLDGLTVERAHLLVRFRRHGTVLEGAEVVVARGGRSVAELSRVMACRVARARTGADPRDPFAVRHAIVRVVHETDGAAIVQIRSRKPAAIREIVRRVEALLPEGELRAPAGPDQGESASDSTTGSRRRPPPAVRPPMAGPSRRGPFLDSPTGVQLPAARGAR